MTGFFHTHRSKDRQTTLALHRSNGRVYLTRWTAEADEIVVVNSWQASARQQASQALHRLLAQANS